MELEYFIHLINRYCPYSSDNTMIETMKKRLSNELKYLNNKKWCKYLIDIYTSSYNKSLQLKFKLTMDFRLILSIPDSYPFKGPIYDMQICYIPNSIEIARVVYHRIPQDIVPCITKYLTTYKNIQLKEYLYTRLLNSGKTKKATQVIRTYEYGLSPYCWSPELNIEYQLLIIKHLISEVGLNYST